MIYSELSGGLGNQLFQYASARALSLRLKTGLVFDLSLLNLDKERVLGLDKFRIPVKSVQKIERSYLSRAIKKLVGKDFPEWLLLEDPVWRYDNRILTVTHKNIILRGYWAFPGYFSGIRKTLLEEIVLKDAYLHKVADDIRQVKSCNSCALHLRFGDFVTNNFASSFFGTLDAGYYTKAIEHVKKLVPETVFFVFSDDLPRAKQTLATITDTRNMIMVNETKSLDDTEEFYIMKNCENFIAANSTFSWWAAWLNTNDSKIIVQPKRYYKNEEAQRFYENEKSLIQENAVLF